MDDQIIRGHGQAEVRAQEKRGRREAESTALDDGGYRSTMRSGMAKVGADNQTRECARWEEKEVLRDLHNCVHG